MCPLPVSIPCADKLAETKKQEAAVHEALKAQQKEAKIAKEQASDISPGT